MQKIEVEKCRLGWYVTISGVDYILKYAPVQYVFVRVDEGSILVGYTLECVSLTPFGFCVERINPHYSDSIEEVLNEFASEKEAEAALQEQLKLY